MTTSLNRTPQLSTSTSGSLIFFSLCPKVFFFFVSPAIFDELTIHTLWVQIISFPVFRSKKFKVEFEHASLRGAS